MANTNPSSSTSKSASIAGKREGQEGNATAGTLRTAAQTAPQCSDSPRETDRAPTELFQRAGDTVRRPRIAILIAEGFDGEATETLYSGLVELGAVPLYVSTHLGTVTSIQGVPQEAEVTLDASPAVLFEALIVPGGEQHVTSLCSSAAALDFVKEQHRLARPILALQEGSTLVEKAGLYVSVNPEQSAPGVFVGMHATAADALPDFVQAMALQTHG